MFPRYCAVVLVHGCFWHGHDCPLFKLPATRREFWAAKIEGNRARDARDLGGLAAAGWQALMVWECALKEPARLPVDAVLSDIVTWLKTDEPTRTIRGTSSARSSACGPPADRSGSRGRGGFGLEDIRRAAQEVS